MACPNKATKLKGILNSWKALNTIYFRKEENYPSRERPVGLTSALFKNMFQREQKQRTCRSNQ